MQYEPPHDKTNKMSVCPAKTQISLGIRPVWSESLLSAWRKLGSLATHWVHSKDSDQSGWMPRLSWIFTERTCHFVGFVMRRLISFQQALYIIKLHVYVDNDLSCLIRKPTNWLCIKWRQINLGIRTVWSESLLCTQSWQWVAKDPSFLHADSEDSDQTGRMPRLLCVFSGRTCHFVGFVLHVCLILYF